MLLTIVKKELKRVFTDRRLIFSVFILPALSIFVVYTIMGLMLANFISDIDENEPVIYILQAPESFRAYLGLRDAQDSMEIIWQDDDSRLEEVKNLILTEEADVLISFDQDFQKAIDSFYINGTNIIPDVEMFYNSSRQYSSTAYNTFQSDYFPGFKESILTERYGIDGLEVFTLNNTNEDVAIVLEGKEAGSNLSFIIPMLMNIMLFAGAMGIGVDVIAGEKERGTMATMLLAPIDRNTIAFGKVIGLGVLSTISAMSTFAAILASMPFSSQFLLMGNTTLLSSISYTPIEFLMLLIILIVQVGIFVGFICLLSVLANSVKEAGTYLTPVYMLVMMAAFATMFSSDDIPLSRFFIPILGNVHAIQEILRKELSYTEFGISVGVSILMICILLVGIGKAFNSEKIMFSQS